MLVNISKTHILISFVFLLILSGAIYTYLENITIPFSFCQPCHENSEPVVDEVEKRVETKHCPHMGVGNLKMKAGLSYPQPSTMIGRTDVNSVTNWNAPLVWEGTFDPVVIDDIYRRMNPRVAVVVLAVGKYTRFLKGFLESGEKYFLVGLRVTYYIFTDNEQDVPNVTLSEGRKITILPVPSAKRWQDVVLSKMKWATVTIDKQIRNEADYLFMMDVDSVFHNRFGAESLSQMSAVLHRGYYKNINRDGFPYERRPESKAYIPAGEGDYYYTAAVWGGYLEDMYRLVKYCYEQSEEDAKNNIEAVWQEESHLNKYFLYNKPAKVLSPEYLWSDYDAPGSDIKLIRISQLVKDYAEVRPNGGH
ncbi:globoside alpha-1,3-N-acetylgalactosaminyltransferase 1-like isoform X1 [Amphiprion ocellaris]|uniref:globoside alpha-1,3-N-acetylgalactosaminyltransferase 1-like isoform X1 n=1 Tax=Amphiprion ocellaris TaxID=80972 RepID=UPI002410CAE1|nr:globoside alpha-1,3-N-acetylgalactosaminyltransferase 1-like isoform X1 [Amphiprion ocellaris]